MPVFLLMEEIQSFKFNYLSRTVARIIFIELHFFFLIYWKKLQCLWLIGFSSAFQVDLRLWHRIFLGYWIYLSFKLSRRLPVANSVLERLSNIEIVDLEYSFEILVQIFLCLLAFLDYRLCISFLMSRNCVCLVTSVSSDMTLPFLLTSVILVSFCQAWFYISWNFYFLQKWQCNYQWLFLLFCIIYWNSFYGVYIPLMDDQFFFW